MDHNAEINELRELLALEKLEQICAADSSGIGLLASLRIEASGGRQSTDAAKSFSMIAYTGGLLDLPEFDVPLVVDLAGLTLAPDVPICDGYGNGVGSKVGVGDRFDNDGRQLRVTGRILQISQAGRNVVQWALQTGETWQAVINCSLSRLERVPRGQPISVNGQNLTGPLLVARGAVLRMIGIVPVSPDSNASVRIAAARASGMSAPAASVPVDPDWRLTPEQLAGAAQEANRAMAATTQFHRDKGNTQAAQQAEEQRRATFGAAPPKPRE